MEWVETLGVYVPLMQTMLWIALIIVAGVTLRPEIAILRPLIAARVKSGSAVRVGPVELGELRQEVETVRSKMHDLNDRVYQLFLLAMSPSMFNNLKKLSSGSFGPYEMSGGLERELRHLRDMGYIDVEAIAAIPTKGSELLDHVRVTPTGRQFVELRDSLE